MYAVFTAGNTNLGGGFGTAYCSYHGLFTWNGHRVIYAAMPWDYQYQGPSLCTSGYSSPNGDPAADAEVTWLVHEIEESTTDFGLHTWRYQTNNYENADLCQMHWGTTYSNGAGTANMNLGGKDFLIQENWVNQPGGGCLQNLGNAGFYVSAVSGVPSPIKSVGTYYPSATLSIPPSGPVTYQWIVTYSNGVLPPDTSAWVQNGAWGFQAPLGSYTITLWATPKDVLGLGAITTQFNYIVCSGYNSPSSPDLPNGCNPPPN